MKNYLEKDKVHEDIYFKYCELNRIIFNKYNINCLIGSRLDLFRGKINSFTYKNKIYKLTVSKNNDYPLCRNITISESDSHKLACVLFTHGFNNDKDEEVYLSDLLSAILLKEGIFFSHLVDKKNDLYLVTPYDFDGGRIYEYISKKLNKVLLNFDPIRLGNYLVKESIKDKHYFNFSERLMRCFSSNKYHVELDENKSNSSEEN